MSAAGPSTAQHEDSTSMNLSLIQFLNDLNITLGNTKSDFENETNKVIEKFQCSKQSAQRMVALSPLTKMDPLSTFFQQHRLLRFLDIFCFWQFSTGFKFHLDLLVRMIIPCDLLDSSNALGGILVHYEDAARSKLVETLFHLASFTCTTLCMLPPCQRSDEIITMNDISHALSVYTSPQWNTAEMASQHEGNTSDIVDGWSIASEVLKVQVDDMLNDIRLSRVSSSTRRVKVEEIVTRLDRVAMIVIEEVLAYLFARLADRPNVQAFINALEEQFDTLYLTLSERIGANRRDEPETTRRNRLQAVLRRIDNGEPTMAELRFCSTTFHYFAFLNPKIRRADVNWNEAGMHNRARYTRIISEHQVSSRIDKIFHWTDDVPIFFENQAAVTADQEIEPLHLPRSVADAEREQLPGWLTRTNFDQRTHFGQRLNAERHDVINVEEDFDEDAPDSDQEYAVYDNNELDSNALVTNQGDQQMVDIGGELEEFYSEICMWIIDPRERDNFGHINSTHNSNSGWVSWFLRTYGHHLLPSASHAQNIHEYINHMKYTMVLELRGSIRQELEENVHLRGLREYPEAFMRAAYEHEEDNPFIRVSINAVHRTRNLYHLNTLSNDRNFNRELMETVIGITLCVCFIESRNTRRYRHSDMMFMIIRRAHFEGELIDRNGTAADLDLVELSMSVSKEVCQNQRFIPQVGQALYFRPLCTLAPQVRMVKAIHSMVNAPQAFLNILFGNNVVRYPNGRPIEYSHDSVLLPVSRSTTTDQSLAAPRPQSDDETRDMLAREVDQGSREYLIRCLQNPNSRLDRSHFNAAIQMLRVVGSGEQGTCGVGLVQGPPGTGKTTNILFLLGALIHHSRFGHVGRNQWNHLRARDNVMRCSRAPDSFRILLIASSNQAVDNIIERLVEHGIDDGEGGRLNPKFIRISKHDYDPPEIVRPFIVREASRRYDDDWEERNNPSLRARRLCAEEVIIFVSTSSSTGSSNFRQLRQSCDIIIHDEGANSSEIETLIPITATRAHNTYNRLFYISLGDEKQLPPLSTIDHIIESTKCHHLIRFDPVLLSQSIFERMINSGRATYSFLAAQWRMHPAISRITSVPFYKCYFHNPSGIQNFVTQYNQPEVDPRQFNPMTFIDTSSIRDCHETDRGEGYFTNTCEAELVSDIIRRLHILVGENGLDNEIAVICPYRSQVQRITDEINASVPALRHHRSRRERNVLVCTVDSMQGSERAIVIFSTTRSNRLHTVGFVKNERRLNISVSRARYLNIIIGDSQAIKSRKEGYGIPALGYINDACARQEEGAELMKAYYSHRDNPLTFSIIRSNPRNQVQTRSAINPVAGEIPKIGDDVQVNFANLYL